jgi:hypothetical protein
MAAAGQAPVLNPMMGRLIRQESGGNPNAVSPKGASGIVQIMPDTARDPGFGVQPLQGWDGVSPKTAPVNEQIRFGNDYLNAMQRINGGDPQLAAAAYNAGPGAVQKYGGIPPYQETQNYVKNVAPQTMTEITPTANVSTQIDYSAMSDEELMRAAGVDASPVAPEPTKPAGFMQRMSDDFARRQANARPTNDAFTQGEIGPLQAGFQQLGQGAGLVGDTAGNIVGSVARYAGDLVPNAIKEPVKNAGFRVYNYAADSAVGDVARDYTNSYKGFAQENPNIDRNLSALANIGGLVASATPIKGVSAASTAFTTGKAVAKPVGKVAMKGIDRLNTKTIRPTAEQLKTASTANYKLADDVGGVLKKEANDDVINYAQSFGVKDPMAAKFAGESPLAAVAKDLEEFRGQPMTLSRATAVDQAITDRLDDAAFHTNGVLNVYGRQLLQIKDKLRNTLTEAADNGLVDGGRGGVDAYKTAVKDWAAQSQISEIQRIVDRASYMDNPATALKTGFRNIATNPGRLNKYPKDVQKAIKNAARDGDLSNILRSQVGSRLISGAVGAATGSAAGPLGTIAGAVAGGATGGIARRAAESMQIGRVNKVVDAIAANSSLPTTTAKRLTKSDLQKAFEAKKGNK